MSFTSRLILCISLFIVALLAVGITGAIATKMALANRDQVLNKDLQLLLLVEEANGLTHQAASTARGYLLAPEPKRRENFNEYIHALENKLHQIEEGLVGKQRVQLDQVQARLKEYVFLLTDVMKARDGATDIAPIATRFADEAIPARQRLAESFTTLKGEVEQEHAETRHKSDANTAVITNASLTIMGMTLCLGVIIAVWLVRSLTQQVGTVVEQVKSSSTELEVTSTQQANAAREQATIAVQVTTASRELLATSRQIAESAQRVAHIADQAAGAASEGEANVEQTQEALKRIKQQVDRIVEHMLALGRKSQRIGSVLEIINELTEQTTILSINATIESVSAGEAGVRFGAVADEIRKLADRVRGSTQEIHALIEDIRSSTNSTIMSTEEGAKSVDDGGRRFTAVAGVFARIITMVRATTEAGREIELSTKQQSSAVEQVNTAIADVANAAKQSESATRQTQQTAGQLAHLSRDLASLVRS